MKYRYWTNMWDSLIKHYTYITFHTPFNIYTYILESKFNNYKFINTKWYINVKWTHLLLYNNYNYLLLNRVFNSAIVLRRFELVEIHLIYEIEKKRCLAPEINTYDIAIMLVKFGKFSLIVFPLLKWYYIVRNGRFSGQNYFRMS